MRTVVTFVWESVCACSLVSWLGEHEGGSDGTEMFLSRLLPACLMHAQASMQLAVLPPEPEPAPSESSGEEQEEEGSMSQVHSDDEDDQLARLLQVCAGASRGRPTQVTAQR